MKTLFTFLLFASCASMVAQNEVDSRLLSKFSEESIISLQEKHPDILSYWQFYLDEGYIVTSPKPGKSYSFEAELKIKDMNNINLFELGLPHPLNEYRYYSIKGSDQILALVPRTFIVKSFNKQK